MPTPANFANTSVKIAVSQYSCASSQSPISLSGNSGITGTAKTIRVIAGDSASTRSESHCLNWRSGIHATNPGDDRLEVIPQPCLDQKDDRKQNPDWL